MRKVYLIRTKMSNMGTEGMLITDAGYNCKTLELPWRENMTGVSSIPSGEYKCVIRRSNRFGITYWVTYVPKRSYILIHSGNYAGDVSEGFKTHVEGCILLGKKHGWLGKQKAILNSRICVRAFMNHMKNEEFMLTVIGGDY
jgi:hypothetical protein